MQSRRITHISLSSVIMAVILGFSASPALAQTSTCVDNETVEVCAEWSQGSMPQEGSDFTVTYHGSAGADVALNIGDPEWRLWTTLVSDGSVTDFGDITLDPTVPSDNFEVSIKDGANAGAVDVESIVLDDAGFTGYSNLGATTISGSVNGAITLIDDGGAPAVGGEVTGLVFIGFSSPLGGVDGPISIPEVSADLLIAGDYGVGTANHGIDIGVIAGDASFSIGGDILSNHSSALAIDIDALGDTGSGKYGVFTVTGSLTNPKATVTITDMAVIAGAGSGVSFVGDFGGTLDLKQGVPGAAGDNFVGIKGMLLNPSGSDGGKIKLNGQNIGGDLFLGATAEFSEVQDGGILSGVFYPCESLGEFKGTATFSSVSAGGQIWALSNSSNGADISGTITINGDYAGFFKVDGKLLSGTVITINGDLKAHSGFDGLLWIVKNVDAGASVTVTGDVIGHVHFPEIFNGDVTINGGITNTGLFKVGDVVTGPHYGDLTVGASLVGDIDIEGIMGGTISVTDDVTGDIHLHSDLSTFASSISVGGSLSGRGRILVDGSCDGSIAIGTNTGSSTLIHCQGGLAAGASIKINTTAGNFNANGDIHVGVITYSSLPDVTFDGCIHI